jgi:hypothetical protein
MTFNPTEHPRANDGKFAEKLGAAPEVGLQGPTTTADIRDLVQQIEPGATKLVYTDQDNGGPRVMTLRDDHNIILNYGVGKWEDLDAALDRYEPSFGGARDFKVIQESRLTPDVEKLSGFLNNPKLSTADITTDELGRLRYAVNHAEFRLAEKELGKLLTEEAPGAFGIAVAEDDEGNAYPLGIETHEAIPNIGRNWGVIDYENIPTPIRDWFVTDGYRLGRDDRLTDYAENLTNSYGDFDDDDIVWDGRPVYRVAVPE